MSKSNNGENIVIVGLGAAGSQLAHLLTRELDESKYNLVVINPRPYYILYPATARLIVSDVDNLEERAFVPVEKILNGKGTFIQAKVERIEEDKKEGKGGRVVLDNGETVSYRVLVLATGASWDHPLSFPDNPGEVSDYIHSMRSSFEKAESLLLVGGGAVGSEIAGEIKDVWPAKKVTIVHGGSLPLSTAYPDKFRRAVESSMRARGIDLVLGDHVDELPRDGATEVKSRKSRALKSDMILSTRGQRFNTEFIAASLGQDVISERGLVNIEPTFQVSKRADIFAIGDIVEWDEQKQAAKAGKHAEIAAKNISRYLKNGRDLRKYKGGAEIIVVTNGKAC